MPGPSSSTGRSRGRPRAVAAADSGVSAQRQILEVAGRLFGDRGYAATSTRAIADGVGIRQASLYYHFHSKDDLLAALLEESVRPVLVAAKALRDVLAPEAVRLHALATVDGTLLSTAPYNAGLLHALPEVRGERFADVRAARRRLRLYYAMHVEGAITQGELHAEDADLATDLVLGMVGGVVVLRAERGGEVRPGLAAAVADGCLRALRCPEHDLPAVAGAGRRLAAGLVGEPEGATARDEVRVPALQGRHRPA